MRRSLTTHAESGVRFAPSDGPPTGRSAHHIFKYHIFPIRISGDAKFPCKVNDGKREGMCPFCHIIGVTQLVTYIHQRTSSPAPLKNLPLEKISAGPLRSWHWRCPARPSSTPLKTASFHEEDNHMASTPEEGSEALSRRWNLLPCATTNCFGWAGFSVTGLMSRTGPSNGLIFLARYPV